MATAPRGPVSTQYGQRGSRPLLRFDTRQQMLVHKIITHTGEFVPVESGEGLAINASLLLSATELARATTDRTLRAALNKIMRNAAKRALDKLRALSRPTYDTGTFMSNWIVDLEDVGGGLRMRLDFANPTPYAKFIHRSGDDPAHTVIKFYIIPYLKNQLQKEVIADISNKLSAPLKRQLFGV
jgi:hypothetical protein